MISDNNNCKLCGSQGRPGVNRKITAPAPPPLSSDSQARLPPSSREVSELELSSARLSLLTLVEGESQRWHRGVFLSSTRSQSSSLHSTDTPDVLRVKY